MMVEMERRRVPVRAIIGASHNTNPFGRSGTFQDRNFEWVVRYVRELAAQHGWKFVPASFADMRREGERVRSY